MSIYNTAMRMAERAKGEDTSRVSFPVFPGEK
jgi:hypothetical protein